MPFLMRWPAGIHQPGREWDGLIGQVDLMATLAEIAGVDRLPDEAGEDSQSFAEVLRDPALEPKQSPRLPLINHGAKGRFAITDANWKLILAHEDQGEELYAWRSIRPRPETCATNRPPWRIGCASGSPI